MKTQLELLNEMLNAVISANLFYNITITKFDINLQGQFKPETASIIKSAFLLQSEKIEGNGFITFKTTYKDSNVTITLT